MVTRKRVEYCLCSSVDSKDNDFRFQTPIRRSRVFSCNGDQNQYGFQWRLPLSDCCSGRLRQELFHQYCTCSSGRERCSRTSDRAFVLHFTTLLVQTFNKIRLMMIFETLWNYVIDLYTLLCAVLTRRRVSKEYDWFLVFGITKLTFKRKKMLILCSYCEVPQFRLRESS